MSSRPALVRKLRAASMRLGLERARVLLAVSGGADSLAMLHAFSSLRERLGLHLEVASIDHRLRRGSAADVAFVRAQAKALGLPFHSARVSIPGATGLEEKARRARYAALKRLANRHGLDFIATAHTADDQAETLLFRLARGAGLKGARGILARRGAVVRPMLEVRRAEVRAYLATIGVEPREDPTNRSSRFARNRIRAQVLPALEQALGDSAVEGLARFARLAADDEAFLARRAGAKARALLTREAGAISADVDPLRRLPAALRRRVLRAAASELGAKLSMAKALELEEALSSKRPRSIALPGGVTFQVRYGRIRFSSAGPALSAPRPSTGPIDAPGLYPAGAGWLEVRAVSGEAPAREGSIRIVPSAVALPLSIRSRMPGDRYRPGGGRSRKLKAFLIDEKIPRERRDSLPLLCDAEGRILWVPGLRPGAAAQAGARAREAWEILWRSGSGEVDATPLEKPGEGRVTRERGPK